MAETKKELSKKDSFLIALSNFLQKNRIVFIIIIIVLILGLIAFTVIRETVDNRIEKSTGLAEEAQELYDQWVTEVDDSKKEGLREECFEMTGEILDRYPNHYAAQRALFIRGNIYFEEESWQDASEEYLEIANSFPESYLSPISLNNAAVAQENNENFESAIELLLRLTDTYKETYPDIAKIYFTKGRLYEEVGNTEMAIEEYEVLEDEYPNNNWTKLARNRIIALEK